MQIAVMSDIHSNHAALRVCVDHALSLGADQFLFLGDYVSDCAYPEKTLSLLRELSAGFPCRFIIGNREEYMLEHLGGADDGWFSPSSFSGNLLHTYRRLSQEDFAFFRGLSIQGRFSMDCFPSFDYCHGCITSTRTPLALGGENARAALNALGTDLLLCGHSHAQGSFSYGGKKLVNPGSVGIPHGHGGKAQFAMLHSDGGPWEESFFQLEYPRRQTVRALHESGLFQDALVWARLTEYALLTGDDRTMQCLEGALDLCQRTQGHRELSRMPEDCWEKAARQIGL